MATPRINFIPSTPDGDVSGFNADGLRAYVAITLDGVPLNITDENGVPAYLHPEDFPNMRSVEQMLKATAAYNLRGSVAAPTLESAHDFQDNTNQIDLDALLYGYAEDQDADHYENWK